MNNTPPNPNPTVTPPRVVRIDVDVDVGEFDSLMRRAYGAGIPTRLALFKVDIHELSDRVTITYMTRGEP